VKTVWAVAFPVIGKSVALATMIGAQTNPPLPADFTVPSRYALLIGAMLSYRLAAPQADSTFTCTHFSQCAFQTSVCNAMGRVRNCGGDLQVTLEVAPQKPDQISRGV